MADELQRQIRERGRPLRSAADLDPLLDRIDPDVAARYDALHYLDETHALAPLHLPVQEEGGSETFPWGE